MTEALLKFASGAEATQKMLPPILETTSLFGNELWWKTIAALQADAEAQLLTFASFAGREFAVADPRTAVDLFPQAR